MKKSQNIFEGDFPDKIVHRIDTIKEEDKDSDSKSVEKLVGDMFHKLTQESKNLKFQRINTKIINNDEKYSFGDQFRKIEESVNQSKKKSNKDSKKSKKKSNKDSKKSRKSKNKRRSSRHKNSSFQE